MLSNPNPNPNPTNNIHTQPMSSTYVYQGYSHFFVGKTKEEEYDFYEENDMYHEYQCEYKWTIFTEEELHEIMTDRLRRLGLTCQRTMISNFHENNVTMQVDCIFTSPGPLPVGGYEADLFLDDLPLFEWQVLEDEDGWNGKVIKGGPWQVEFYVFEQK